MDRNRLTEIRLMLQGMAKDPSEWGSQAQLLCHELLGAVEGQLQTKQEKPVPVVEKIASSKKEEIFAKLKHADSTVEDRMSVREMIAALLKFPPDMPVSVSDGFKYYFYTHLKKSAFDTYLDEDGLLWCDIGIGGCEDEEEKAEE